MSALTFDTHAVIKDLTDAGLPRNTPRPSPRPSRRRRTPTWKTAPPRATTQAEDNAVIDEREGEDEIPLKQFLQELKQDGLL